MERSGVFARRTGKVLAASRAVLGMVFLLALVIDPQQPARYVEGGTVLLTVYLAWCGVLVVVAWSSWWYDFRLAKLVHAVDIAAFIGAVYFTETPAGDFSSPFIAFAAFLLITATLRWGWYGVVWTALALAVLNAAAGMAMIYAGYGIDPYRFGRRQTYMVVLSVMMVWLGVDQRRRRLVHLPEPPGTPGERRTRVLASALTFARETLRARGGAVALIREDEPWVDLVIDRDGVALEERVGPASLEEHLAQPATPVLFDSRRGRRIGMSETEQFRLATGPFEFAIADLAGINEGIVVGFHSAAGPGQLLIWGIPDMAIDDLPEVAALARELGLALDREAMASIAQSTAVSGIRNALARDLHDSVAQFLAGTLFRLEALRRWVREGNDPEGEFQAMKEALRREQGQLRLMIERLRRGEKSDRRTDLVDEIGTLLEEMGLHWHIATRLDAGAQPMPVPIHLAHELRQLVREGVANAARHGACSEVVIALDRAGDHVRLAIGDNGKGFPVDGPQPPRPRSISERVAALGGTLEICNNAGGAMLEIDVPARLEA